MRKMSESILAKAVMSRNDEDGIQITFLLDKDEFRTFKYNNDDKVAKFVNEVVPANSLIAYMESRNPKQGYDSYRVMILSDKETGKICVTWHGDCEVEKERIKKDFLKKVLSELKL